MGADGPTAAHPPQADSSRPTASTHLARALSRILGTPVHEVAVSTLAGGASREILRFDARTADGTLTCVLRADHRGNEAPEANAAEAAVLAAAGHAEVPCARLIHDDTAGELIGTPALLLEHVTGEAIARRILRDERFAAARTALPDDLARAAARVHAIDPAAVARAELTRLSDPVERLAADYREIGIVRPVIEVSLRRLAETRPPVGGESLVHGDFRLGNLMVDESGLAAVLDWELAHLGDPDEDLGYLCMRAWRFGGPGEVAGLGDLDAFLGAYAEASGRRPDTAAVRWWQARATLWWAIGTLRQMQRAHEEHPNELELLAIGRRCAEQEHDLLRLLFAEHLDPAAEAPASSAPGSPATSRGPGLSADALFSAPTADELLGALSRWLTRDIVAGDGTVTAFRGRVARNVVDLVRRQRALEPAALAEVSAGLARLGAVDEHALAARIREGADPAEAAALVPVLDAITRWRLRTSNPAYLQET
ncbi:phosphotransferase family protein [Brevibacterium sp. R8603A2]|uniref:phosphotransferase family protein n=1 Tax=Brevibacterium sp. R8603A2 TaxID=2929779 RepID=UPI001FF8ED0D|nr:phosphotransferase family protein [Brevibacterium sp. R8603A2]MCK1803121.1 phosphotransferase family protein [Brevibacterium sp. R8603A2]